MNIRKLDVARRTVAYGQDGYLFLVQDFARPQLPIFLIKVKKQSELRGFKHYSSTLTETRSLPIDIQKQMILSH